MNDGENKHTEENTSEEDDVMNTLAERNGYNRLDFSKLRFYDKPVSSKEAFPMLTCSVDRRYFTREEESNN